ncbi:MAG: hypothetical protein RLP45_17455, partial [Haliea sp.]
MENWKTETDDRELERLFAEARRYPLLSAGQERDIDGSKWQAVADIQALLLASEGGRAFFRDLLDRIVAQPPDVAQFDNRDHHFLLRRELVAYLPGGAHASGVVQLASALAADDLVAAGEIATEMALP